MTLSVPTQHQPAPTRTDVEFTRKPGGVAEPIPDGASTPFDDQLRYQPCTARRIAPWGFSIPLRLRHRGHQVLDQTTTVDVWEVPARAWHPGDQVELGPIPAGVVVRFERLHTPSFDAPNLSLEVATP